MTGRFPFQKTPEHDDLHRALDVSLAAVQAAVDALSKVDDSGERADMAHAVHDELQAIRALVAQLDYTEATDPEAAGSEATASEAELPRPRHH